MWMSVEDALYAMIDRPEYMHRMLDRMTHGYLSMLDQLEEQGLLCSPQSLIHCRQAPFAPCTMRRVWLRTPRQHSRMRFLP